MHLSPDALAHAVSIWRVSLAEAEQAIRHVIEQGELVDGVNGSLSSRLTMPTGEVWVVWFRHGRVTRCSIKRTLAERAALRAGRAA